MKRLASEVLRDLEIRVAHLERRPIGQRMEENYRDSDENVLFVANSLNDLLKKKRLHTDLVAEIGQGVSILIDNSLGNAMEKLQGIRLGVKWFGDDKLYHLGLMWLVSENRDGDIILTRAESRRRVARLESRTKIARSIPRPPRYRGLVDLKRATSISDKALDREYGYGLSKPNTFGYEANKYSSLYALNAIQENLDLVLSNPDDSDLIEMVADAVHDGWSYAAYNVDDPRYQTQPEKRDNRIALADAPYRSLSEGEKEKDRVIARALIYTYYMASKR